MSTKKNILCDYGCGNFATVVFGNGKNCCSSHYKKCPTHREKMKIHMIQVHKNNSMGPLISQGLANMNLMKKQEMRKKWYDAMYVNPLKEDQLSRNKRNSESNKKSSNVSKAKRKIWYDNLSSDDKIAYHHKCHIWQNDKEKKKQATEKMIKTTEKII